MSLWKRPGGELNLEEQASSAGTMMVGEEASEGNRRWRQCLSERWVQGSTVCGRKERRGKGYTAGGTTGEAAPLAAPR